jgi:hypothetical protein
MYISCEASFVIIVFKFLEKYTDIIQLYWEDVKVLNIFQC